MRAIAEIQASKSNGAAIGVADVQRWAKSHEASYSNYIAATNATERAPASDFIDATVQNIAATALARKLKIAPKLKELADERLLDLKTQPKFKDKPRSQLGDRVDASGNLRSEAQYRADQAALEDAETKKEQQRQLAIAAARRHQLRQNTRNISPFLAFLGQNSISMAHKPDLSPDANPMIAGYGPMFQRKGKPLDLLVKNAIEDGFLPVNIEENGDAVKELSELISNQLRNMRRSILAAYGQDGNDQIQARFDRQNQLDREAYEEAHNDFQDVAAYNDALAIEQAYAALGEDPDIDAGSNVTEAEAMRALGFTEQEIQDAETQRQPKQDSDGATTSQDAARAAQDGGGARAGAQTAQGDQAEDGLTSYTPEELRARDQRIAEQAKAQERSKAVEESEDRRIREQRDIASRQDASADNFVLGQDANDALSGQQDIFAAPSLQQPAKTQPQQQAKITSTFTGKFGKGMNPAPARQEAARLNKLQDGNVYTAEEHGDAALENPYHVVGRTANAAKGRGRNALFAQPAPALSNFRKLTGNHNASTAKADAEEMLGIDSPVKVMQKADYLLARKRVPMWYDLDEKVIYYNTAFKDRDRARDAQWMMEEILHAIDHTGGANTISLSSGRFNEGGDLRAEIEEAHRSSSALKEQLDYPLIFTDFTDDRKAVELFARVGVLFKGFPEALKATAPKTYEVYRDIFRKLQGLSGEVQQPSAIDSGKKPGGLGADRDGRAFAGQSSGGQSADSKLERFRNVIVEAIQGERDGRAG